MPGRCIDTRIRRSGTDNDSIIAPTIPTTGKYPTFRSAVSSYQRAAAATDDVARGGSAAGKYIYTGAGTDGHGPSSLATICKVDGRGDFAHRPFPIRGHTRVPWAGKQRRRLETLSPRTSAPGDDSSTFATDCTDLRRYGGSRTTPDGRDSGGSGTQACVSPERCAHARHPKYAITSSRNAQSNSPVQKYGCSRSFSTGGESRRKNNSRAPRHRR